jgi:ribosomal protein S27AE
MSADNWRICPRCKIRAAEKAAKMYADATAAYGKVDPEMYLEKLKEAQVFGVESPEETLREDYEIYIDEDGEFFVSYRGGCDKCGLVFSFKHEDQVPLGEE